MTFANAAWSFLRDKSTAMLSRIKHIGLEIYSWDEYDGFQVLDPQVWKDLMGIIEPNMTLQHLSLHSRGLLADLRDSDVSGDSMMVSDERHPRVTELTRLPKLNRLIIYFSGFREPNYSVVRHKHRPACFTAHGHDVCYFADSALQFAALAKVLRGSLLCDGRTLSSNNTSAQLMRDPEPVANDIEGQDLDTRPNPKSNYFLSMQTDDDGARNCLLPQQHPKPANNKSGNDQAHSSGVDKFDPLGGSASLDRVKSRGRRLD